MRDQIEKKLGCTIEQYADQFLRSLKGLCDPPGSLGVLTDEEWEYMRKILVSIYGDSVFYLKNDEIKECPVCKKGQMLPSNQESKVNYCYVCNNCGALWNIDPAGVIVE